MTSFSVSAAEFVPMAMRAGPTVTNHQPTSQDPISMFNQMSSATVGNANIHGNGNALSQGSQDSQGNHKSGNMFGGGGSKATVCTPYFRQGMCNDPACRYAHALGELDYTAQQQLISMAGGEEFLPVHFTQGMFATQNAQRLFSPSAPNTPSNLSGKSLGHHHASANRTGMAGGGGMTGTPSSLAGSNAGGNNNNNAPWEEVRVTLPARCHYPHSIGGTYYDYLNVKRYCAAADIEASYRSWRSQGYKAAKSIDQSKADAMDRLVVEARLVLGNPTMRNEYDALLPMEEGTVLPPASSMNGEDSIW